jgi:hypothetical protein
MSEKEMIFVNVNVEISTDALQAIVENAKKIAGTNENGFYDVDTADKVSEMISRFLSEKDFDAYVSNIENYK